MLTTVATFAATSKSYANAPNVVSNALIRAVDNSAISRRHSVVRALNMFKEISNRL